jgi:hypothetical protein
MKVRFSETTLEGDREHLKLLDRSGKVLLELTRHEVDDAIRAGFIDANNYHYSMFEYARMRCELGSISRENDAAASGGNPLDGDAVATFLESLQSGGSERNERPEDGGGQGSHRTIH